MKKIILFLLGILIVLGCQDSPLAGYTQEPEIDPPTFTFSEENVVKGRMRIKLKQEPINGVKVRSNGAEVTTGIRALDSVASTIRITHLERTFPHAGKYEERTRREGLHLWYNVKFSEEITAKKAIEEVSLLNEIVIASPVLKINTKASSPFNDPQFPNQFALENRGEQTWQVAGADIRITEVWEQYNGHPDIVIAVLDEGVLTTHEDLAESIWINPGEIAGNGVDDDKNGYVDDINGYNFLNDSPDMAPAHHGTHVAGIIGARNNNKKGISGIAGGNGSSGTGVRLMCCQILKGNDEAATVPEAIKYGADNGAIISQNSWGFSVDNPKSRSFDEPAILAAIDYFVKYAGCDNNGNQLPESPMKGGIVLFAVNNKNVEDPKISAPADYEKVIGVASMGADFKKASYSDYGDFVDISAPGGMVNQSTQGILSTSASSTKGYIQMSGASMACPHVSGVAALVVQKYGIGKLGFTADQLIDILLYTAYDIDSYNPDYVGKLGAGCVNAYAALNDELPDFKPILIENNIITDGKLLFKATNAYSGKVELTIHNNIGARVLKKSMNVIRYKTNTIDISSLASGSYTINYVVLSNGHTVIEKFVKY